MFYDRRVLCSFSETDRSSRKRTRIRTERNDFNDECRKAMPPDLNAQDIWTSFWLRLCRFLVPQKEKQRPNGCIVMALSQRSTTDAGTVARCCAARIFSVVIPQKLCSPLSHYLFFPMLMNIS